jgi:hypothetical protein
MNTLLVSYDLLAPEKDYEKLWDHLKSYLQWARPLESVWLIRAGLTAGEMKILLRDNYVDQNDKLFVVDVTGRAVSWSQLPEKVSQWIKDYL